MPRSITGAIALNDGPQAAGIPAVQVWQTSWSCTRVTFAVAYDVVECGKRSNTNDDMCTKGYKSTGEGRAFSVNFISFGFSNCRAHLF